MTLFETGTSKDTLPYLSVTATTRINNPLENADTNAQWVKEHVKGSVNFLLAEGLYQLLLSDVPDVPDEELESAIELKAADLISYDLDDAVMDIIQLPSEAYRGRMRMAFIVASKKEPLRQWLMALIQKNIRVAFIDIEITQLRNLALANQNYNESGIFHLQSDQSKLVLNFNNEMVLSRAFDIGLTSLINETTVQDGELELTVSEDAQSEIQIESLVLEIRRSFDYYEAQLGLGAIAEIHFLCHSDHQDLAEKLAKKLGVRFSLLRPEDFMHIQLPDPDSDPVAYYGLAGSIYRETFQ